MKGRILKNVWKGSKCVDKMREEDNEPKYIYMYPCAKSQILYGLYKTQKHIKEKKEVIICEAEKGVMQLWTYGYKNCVSIGGHSLSPYQKEKIIRNMKKQAKRNNINSISRYNNSTTDFIRSSDKSNNRK